MIADNGTVIVDTSHQTLRKGNICVIRNGDHLIVKRIQKIWNDRASFSAIRKGILFMRFLVKPLKPQGDRESRTSRRGFIV
ncbi:S24 family peptidase [Marinobacter sp.]|uniref:S24 family peptidase n=1 Tax=Marinobacter sp. TaxID=50741 RepID=UPI003A8CA3FA